ARAGEARFTSIWDVLFQSTAVWSFIHVIAAAWITGSVAVIAGAASHLRRGHETGVFTAAVRLALPILVVGVLLAFVAGDRLGGILIEQQPMKKAAGEQPVDTARHEW